MIKAAKEEVNIRLEELNSKKCIISQILTQKGLNKLTTIVSLELMLSTGIRVGELSSIKLTSIFLEERKIKIFGKGARERYVFIPDKDLCQLIMSYIHAREIVSPSPI